MWSGNTTWIEACSTALLTLVICLPCPSTRDKLTVQTAFQGCCCNACLVKSAAAGSAGWQAIKLQSSHWYQQTSLSILMVLWLHCVQCTCSCKQTDVGVHAQIIPLTGNVFKSCYANRWDYSIKWYAIKWAINARKSAFVFWFSTFYSNKWVMQLSCMRLSGLHCNSNFFKSTHLLLLLFE